jgi:hypothetical protein
MLNVCCWTGLEKLSVDHTHFTRSCVQSTADPKTSPAHGATIWSPENTSFNISNQKSQCSCLFQLCSPELPLLERTHFVVLTSTLLAPPHFRIHFFNTLRLACMQSVVQEISGHWSLPSVFNKHCFLLFTLVSLRVASVTSTDLHSTGPKYNFPSISFSILETFRI